MSFSAPPPPSQPTGARRTTHDMGKLAEALVAQWLVGQGWTILQHRWRCRLGELDLIAAQGAIAPPLATPDARLTFVEVKARSRKNWDADGLLAVNLQKQTKLWQAAQTFLAEHPHLAELPCRFDVALVRCDRSPHSPIPAPTALPLESLPQPQQVKLGTVVAIAGYRLSLQHYIPDAFGL